LGAEVACQLLSKPRTKSERSEPPQNLIGSLEVFLGKTLYRASRLP